MFEREQDRLRVRGRWGEVAIVGPDPTAAELLHRMQLGPVSLESALNAASLGLATSVVSRVAVLTLLEQLSQLVVRTLGTELTARQPVPLISLVPMTPQARVRIMPLDPDLPVRLSSFALLRTDGAMLTIESPLSLYRVLLHSPETGAIAAALAVPGTLAQLAQRCASAPELVADAVAYLAAVGMVVVAERGEQTADTEPAPRPRFAEDGDPVLSAWAPAELAFHVHSTQGRHDHDFGGTYPGGRRPCPEPVLKQPPAGPQIPLYRPDISSLLETDRPFTAVLEGRSSIRTYDDEPPSSEQLGELLYRGLRTRSLVGPPGAAAHEATLADRPYPAGGALHELEFYVVIGDCAGLERGVYAYDTGAHALTDLAVPEAVGAPLLARAQAAATLDRHPPVLVLITARFRRIQWKYAGLGYALVLKHVGVVQQTLYLVATAMGLAACAIGNGEIDESCRALGLDWRTEATLGSFALGRPHPARAGVRRTGARHPMNDAPPHPDDRAH